jgi:PAS domain S-box-containing protein
MDAPAEARFRAVLEAAPDAMLTVSADGRITMANTEAERLFGYPRAELVGQSVESLLPESFREAHSRHRRHFQRYPTRRPMGLGLDLVGRRRDGTEFPTEVGLSPLPSDEGLTVIVVVRDITERRRAEAERAALAREQAARAEAEAANRAKDEFVAVVSHELRTPLTAILGWAVLLQNNRADEQLVERALQAIERNARVQRQVIDDLLDVSAITAGKLSLEIAEVDVNAVLAAAEESVRPVADAKGLDLVLDVPAGLPPVLGDGRRLQQVYWNLFSNAVKFTPQGGRVTVSARQTGANIEVTVADDGIGMSADLVPQVFERFRQRDSSAARSHGGLGLGLAIVRELVLLHGGAVDAMSAGEGEGSTFTVTLPVPQVLGHSRNGRSGNQQAPAPATLHDVRGLHVLIVDDDPETLRLLDTALSSAGMVVTVLESPAEALRRLPDEAPDVLVSDIGMPGLDGYQFIGAVRRLGLSLPAIALTGYGRSVDAERALAAGFQMHLAKPVLPDELLAGIAHVTGRDAPADLSGRTRGRSSDAERE